MRLSVDPDDPGYAKFVELSLAYRGMVPAVRLDGEKIQAITADEERGIVIVPKRVNGELVFDPVQCVIEQEELRGVVRIVWEPVTL